MKEEARALREEISEEHRRGAAGLCERDEEVEALREELQQRRLQLRRVAEAIPQALSVNTDIDELSILQKRARALMLCTAELEKHKRQEMAKAAAWREEHE